MKTMHDETHLIERRQPTRRQRNLRRQHANAKVKPNRTKKQKNNNNNNNSCHQSARRSIDVVVANLITRTREATRRIARAPPALPEHSHLSQLMVTSSDSSRCNSYCFVRIDSTLGVENCKQVLNRNRYQCIDDDKQDLNNNGANDDRQSNRRMQCRNCASSNMPNPIE